MGLLLLFLLLLLLLGLRSLTSPARGAAELRYEQWQRAAQRFWLLLFYQLAHRVRSIWRYCRRHYGWGIEILDNVGFLLRQSL